MTIDPDFLDELDRFDSSLKRETTSQHQGEQESPDVGEGLTFSDYRRYAPGDDTRLIDWKLYARTEEYYIKQYEEERNLTVHVLVDSSESMDFGEGERHKFEYAAKLGLGFCYLTAEENNDFRFSTFGDDFERLDTGRSNRGELLRVIDLLNEHELGGRTDFRAALESYAASISSRSLVVVLSDFLGELDDIEEGLAALARNELVTAQVLSPDELDPEVMGDTVFEEPETDRELRTYFGGRLAQQYQTRLQQFTGEVAERASDLRATHALVDTGDDFFDSFASLWVG
ncbi:DUF58 domain-containing protein [Salinigranum rubrum]|uniref:DUF58 domain-containing protein n=1 Tax=Salinigranum rubrum TaxID=755307 RepID=A0A2I8VI38_9EURY|nr:DUF58 domain-containing protein [Salinigranum rubrum]AUV81603.1 DUF58 domain-containing protein [Salinigranum rubrum]